MAAKDPAQGSPRAPVKVSTPARVPGSPPLLDYSLLGNFYPYAVPGAVRGSEENKMKEAEDYLAYHPKDIKHHNLHRNLSSPIKAIIVKADRYLISPSGVYLIYYAKKKEVSPSDYFYYIKCMTTNEKDRILRIAPDDDKRPSSIHWLSTGDIFYVLRKGKNELRLSLYDALKNEPIGTQCSRGINSEVLSQIMDNIDLSIPWEEVMMKERAHSNVYFTNIRKPDCLVSIVDKYLLVIKFDWITNQKTSFAYYTFQLNTEGLKSRLFINFDGTIDIYVEGGRRVKGPNLASDLRSEDTVKLLDNVIEQEQPELPAGIIPFEEILTATEIYDSNIPIMTNQSYYMVKDYDHYLVNRPEGENVLKIRRFRATVGSLTLEGEYIVPCPNSPDKANNLHIGIRGNLLAVGNSKSLTVYLLEGDNKHKIAEYDYPLHAVKILLNARVACVLNCPLQNSETELRERYFILATGYSRDCVPTSGWVFRSILQRDDEDQIHFFKVTSVGRDGCFIATIPDSPDIYFVRIDNDRMVIGKRFQGFRLTQDEIKEAYRIIVDGNDNILVARIEKHAEGLEYDLVWSRYTHGQGWKQMRVNINECFLDEIKDKTIPQFKIHCWIDSVILAFPKPGESTKVYYLTLEEKENSLVIR